MMSYRKTLNSSFAHNYICLRAVYTYVRFQPGGYAGKVREKD